MHIDQLNYLEIDDYPVMKNLLNTGRYAVWDRLFPINSKTKLDIDQDEIY